LAAAVQPATAAIPAHPSAGEALRPAMLPPGRCRLDPADGGLASLLSTRFALDAAGAGRPRRISGPRDARWFSSGAANSGGTVSDGTPHKGDWVDEMNAGAPDAGVLDKAGAYASQPNSGAPGFRQFVILVADDEVLIRNLVTLLMQEDGHFVLSAADGHEGLELSRHYPGVIDLVITDLEMPRLNGSDLCAHLLSERPGIKVLVMSGRDITEIVSQNVNLPFLPKPFDGHALRARVDALLGMAPRTAASRGQRIGA